MSLTIQLQTWHFPLVITIGGLLAALFVVWLESKNARDFSIPFFSLGAMGAWLVASIASWTMYIIFSLAGGAR